MKIEKKLADIKYREKRCDDIQYIVIQAFNEKDTSHYQVYNGKVYQILPDDVLSNSVNGGKLNKYGVLHGICTKYNSITISLKDYPEEDDIELCRHLIMTLRQRHKIDENNIIRQIDITGEVSPKKWFNRGKWEEDILEAIRKMLED